MTQPPLSNDSGRIFEWLGNDTKGVPYHLHPLNLSWSNEGVEHDLAVYRNVAERLALDTAYWSAIIREDNWRFSLIGCVCLLVSRRTDFFDDLRFPFEEGSWVIPQLAVTMALLHPVEASACFESVLETPELRDHPQRCVCAELLLIRLRKREESMVTLDGWGVADRDRALIANHVVKRQWDFWNNRVTAS